MKTLSLLNSVFRIKHWVKNTFIFIPSFFAGHFLLGDELVDLIQAFFSVCLVASSIYIINDIRDVEMDRLHPEKMHRPFAARLISPIQGYLLMIVILGIGLTSAYHLSTQFFGLCLLYLAINIAYSLGLKSIAIVDLLLVSSGFLIRVYMGGVISGVAVSHWLSIMIFLLSLFIVLAKRSDDIRIFEEDGTVVRKTSSKYNRVFINSCITMVSGIIIVCYILYCVSPEITQQWQSDYIFVTTIFVIAGIMRYLQLTMVENKTGSPVQILYKDKFIILTLIGWLLAFGFIIYI
ncbi:UbiA prenyltransferase family protein [Reichenbachiella agarivorans]|uniref:UbiA prenyltransferase family protein n=1 Tax=Reichenbachiella agarivorans TaxID=2979464 RepID=A0ABY6CQY1_9BACT|nr:UbiA prenyltransferase family protein [Reichenbachiella agarivorans]UXP32440.1 UbiA prenyltransferase family protein [Reichenbachiella agarivorans]